VPPAGKSVVHPSLVLAAYKTLGPKSVYSVWHLPPRNTLSPAVVNKPVMSSVPSAGQSVIHPALVFTADKSLPCQPFKSSILNDGKKTLILWNKSNLSGKTILFGNAFVARVRTPSKDSGENSKTHMNRTTKKFVFLVTPKAKSFHA